MDFGDNKTPHPDSRSLFIYHVSYWKLDCRVLCLFRSVSYQLLAVDKQGQPCHLSLESAKMIVCSEKVYGWMGGSVDGRAHGWMMNDEWVDRQMMDG